MPKVLIVEDEPNIAESLRFLMTREGFEVTLEPNGANAMAKLAEQGPFDVVVLDVMLPNRSGFDILRDLRLGAHASLPVLMLTAKGQTQDKKTALDLGVSEFMTKPFSNAEVVDTVKRLAQA
ncbi:MAG: response regulator [Pseudomonadota bacterium]